MSMDTRFNEEELAHLLWSLDPVRIECLRLSFEKYKEFLSANYAPSPSEFLEARGRLVHDIANACPKKSGWTEIRIDNVIHLGLLLDIIGRK